MNATLSVRRTRWPFIAFALVAVLMVAAQEPSRRQIASTELVPPARRAKAPDFTLTDVNGKQIALSSYKGRVVLLDFWATTCGGCKVELPWYVDFNARYRDQGLSLIGLDMYGESAGVIKPFMLKWHMDYPVAIGTDALGARFDVREMPRTLLIDRDGRIAFAHAGVVDKASFENDLRHLLQE